MNENTKIVFDILGVEPNERFKLEDVPLANYYIDKNLTVWFEIKKYRDRSNYNLCDFLIGNIKIIKLPKKKKKLRDLTKEELQKWTEKNCKYSSRNLNYCEKCIFNNVACFNTSRSWLDHKDLYSDKFLDQEIEVE